MPFDMLPVIHARTFELCIVQLETERLDEMQCRFRGCAQPRHVARVRRDFRFNQNNVHLMLCSTRVSRVVSGVAPETSCQWRRPCLS